MYGDYLYTVNSVYRNNDKIHVAQWRLQGTLFKEDQMGKQETCPPALGLPQIPRSLLHLSGDRFHLMRGSQLSPLKHQAFKMLHGKGISNKFGKQ